MSKTKATLPKDTSGDPIGCLEPTEVTENQTTSASAAGGAFPTGIDEGDIVRCAATAACYLNFSVGAEDADTSDFVMPAGVEYFRVPNNATHYSVLQVSAGGVFSITKME